jgi:hypothetical protein
MKANNTEQCVSASAISRKSRAAAPFVTLMTAALLCTGLAACVVAPEQPVVVHAAPPPPRVEVAPAPREGFVWERGHWAWRQGGYVWEPGHWEQVRVGYHWVPGHWAPHGPDWVWVGGHWAP